MVRELAGEDDLDQFEGCGGPEVATDLFGQARSAIEDPPTDDDAGAVYGADFTQGIDDFADAGEV